MNAGTVPIGEQLIAASYDVWEGALKSDSGARIIRLDGQTHQLLKYLGAAAAGPYADSGRVFTWEDGLPQGPRAVPAAGSFPWARL